MGIKDLFDNDPKSKRELRQEIDAKHIELVRISENLNNQIILLNNELNKQQSELVNFNSISADLSKEKDRLIDEIIDLKLWNESKENCLVDLEKKTQDKQQEISILLSNQTILQESLESIKLDLAAEKKLSHDLHSELHDLKVVTSRIEAAHLEVASEKRRIAEREATVYKNFAEMQRREQALAENVEKFKLAKESADFSKISTIKSYEDEITGLNKRISQIEQEKRNAERETREAKFLYEAMFTPYKEKAFREGRSIRDVEIEALKTQLFEAKEILREFRINGEPELKAAQERIAALHKSNEYAKQDKNSAENIANKLRNELSVLNRQLDSEKMLHQVRIQRQQNAHESVLEEKDAKIKDLTNLYDALRKIKSSSNVQKVDTSHLDKKIAKLTEELNTLRNSNNLIDINFYWNNPTILSWMLQEGTPETLELPSPHTALIGSGPWKRDELGSVMESNGFKLWQLPDPDIEHVVIGRHGWIQQPLEEQIQLFVGKPLRIYSQEMWFAYLCTGRDPFDTNDIDLLLAFAENHEGLQFLINYQFKWPEISLSDGGHIIDPSIKDFGIQESPMHMLDYRVGTTSPHSSGDRRLILQQCFATSKLPFGNDCTESYKKAWGRAGSVQRLYRMALHIKFLIEGPSGRDYRKPQALADWIDDLNWLKKKYYKKGVHKFTWPNLNF
jgi:hypothetical protein